MLIVMPVMPIVMPVMLIVMLVMLIYKLFATYGAAMAIMLSSHRARPGIAFKKKVDYHDPPTSFTNDDAGTPVLSHVTLTPPGQTRRLSLQAPTAIVFSATLLYYGNTRGSKNWTPRTSSLEADI